MESPRGLSLRALAMCVSGLALVGPCPGGRVAARRAAIASTLHSGEYILRNEYSNQTVAKSPSVWNAHGSRR